MNNMEAIQAMNREQMAVFLEHVFETGLQLGLYAQRQADWDDDALTAGYYDSAWLMAEAEPGTRFVFDEDGEPLLTQALVNAIRLNAGFSEKRWTELAAEFALQDEKQLRFPFD